MTNYAIDDGEGQRITAGVQHHEVWRMARRIATERKQSVFVYEEGAGENAEATEVEPCIQAIIYEQGCGFPAPFCHVPGKDGELYLVRDIVSPIHTAERPGANSYVHALVELASWDDIDEGDEFQGLVEVLS